MTDDPRAAGMQGGRVAFFDGMDAVAVTLRRSARARRFSLRVSRLDGRVTLSVPLRAPEAEAMAFLRSHEDWVRQALAEVAVPAPVTMGQTIPVEGRPLRLTATAGRAVTIAGDSLLVPGDAARAGLRAQAFLRELARARLTAAVDRRAGQLGRKVARITLRDTRSRWGSCTAEGALMFSWRLIMAPPAVLDYVAAHEVAHLIEMNHSDAFWAVVARLCPDWRSHRDWLRREGQGLHSYRFGAAG